MGKIDLLKFMKSEKKPDYPGMTEQQSKILARVARTGGLLGPINKTTMEDLNKTKVEHSIDLRKEKSISDTSEESTQVVAITPDNIKVAAEIQEPSRMPALKPGHKQIVVIIDMTLQNGEEDFMEKLKLNLISNINNVIVSANVHTKTQSGYTVNRVKLNTEINSR